MGARGTPALYSVPFTMNPQVNLLIYRNPHSAAGQGAFAVYTRPLAYYDVVATMLQVPFTLPLHYLTLPYPTLT